MKIIHFYVGLASTIALPLFFTLLQKSANIKETVYGPLLISIKVEKKKKKKKTERRKVSVSVWERKKEMQIICCIDKQSIKPNESKSTAK